MELFISNRQMRAKPGSHLAQITRRSIPMYRDALIEIGLNERGVARQRSCVSPVDEDDAAPVEVPQRGLGAVQGPQCCECLGIRSCDINSAGQHLIADVDADVRRGLFTRVLLKVNYRFVLRQPQEHAKRPGLRAKGFGRQTTVRLLMSHTATEPIALIDRDRCANRNHGEASLLPIHLRQLVPEPHDSFATSGGPRQIALDCFETPLNRPGCLRLVYGRLPVEHRGSAIEQVRLDSTS